MMDVLQTNIVFNNILIISSKFFSKHSIYVKDNSYLIFSSKYTKVRFIRFYYLKTDFIRILRVSQGMTVHGVI